LKILILIYHCAALISFDPNDRKTLRKVNVKVQQMYETFVSIKNNKISPRFFLSQLWAICSGEKRNYRKNRMESNYIVIMPFLNLAQEMEFGARNKKALLL
jgi:hypothetical protein